MAYSDVKFKFKKIGKNVFISNNVYFRYPELVEIGDNVTIDDFCYFTTAVKIEDYVHIGPHCSIIGGRKSKLIMRNYSGLSAGCRIICGSDDYLGSGLTNPTIPIRYRAKTKILKVELKKHVVLGTNCVVHPGVVVGEGASAGSMTLITQDLDEWWIYIGIPAKKYKERTRENILRLEKMLFKENLK